MTHPKQIIIIDVPFVFTWISMCPTFIPSMETLKYCTYLKEVWYKVQYINLRSHKRTNWIKRWMGVEGKLKVPMYVSSKWLEYLEKEVQHTDKQVPIVLSCNIFLWWPYSYDNDLIVSIIHFLEKKWYTDISIGWNFVELHKDYFKTNFKENIIEITKFIYNKQIIPDFDFITKDTFWYFEIIRWCVNKCSFCVAGKEPFMKIHLEEVIDYLKHFSKKHRPKFFFNWDPNVLIDEKFFIEFIKKYKDAWLRQKLSFALWFQPNKVTEKVAQELSGVGLTLCNLPFETGSLKDKKRLNKPYSIISSIKALTLFSKYWIKMSSFQSSFLFWYEDDDFESIFRIFLSIISIWVKPLPFPIAFLGGTKDFEGYQETIWWKDISHLNPQLFPSIKTENLKKYIWLYKFLNLRTPKQCYKNLSILTEDLQEIFLKVDRYTPEFIRLCQEAHDDTDDELQKIETRIKQKKETILSISVSPRRNSIWKKLWNIFFKEYKSKQPNFEVEKLDLSKEPLEFINEDFINFVFEKKPFGNLDPKAQHLVRLTERYIAQLKKADKIVFTIPMWTLSIPSLLKAYLEMVASYMFYYSKTLFPPKKVFCILTRDGSYLKWDNWLINVQEESVKAALWFMWISSDIKFIVCEGFWSSRKVDTKIRELISKTAQELADYSTEFTNINR